MDPFPAREDSPKASRLENLIAALRPLREQVLKHRIYRLVAHPAALRSFMQAHVFAVWDFMTLLKSLQRAVTCVKVPWLPPRDPLAARLVNEIVLGEESDELGPHRYLSHFELYLEAMEEAGADTSAIRKFLTALRSGRRPDQVLPRLAVPDQTRRFVMTTLALAQRPVHAVAAAFFFGREDVIPEMFRRLLEQLEVSGARPLSSFRLYLERHERMDAENHGPLSQRLVSSICGSDDQRWHEAADAACVALQARLDLWEGVARGIETGMRWRTASM